MWISIFLLVLPFAAFTGFAIAVFHDEDWTSRGE